MNGVWGNPIENPVSIHFGEIIIKLPIVDLKSNNLIICYVFRGDISISYSDYWQIYWEFLT